MKIDDRLRDLLAWYGFLVITIQASDMIRSFIRIVIMREAGV